MIEQWTDVLITKLKTLGYPVRVGYSDVEIETPLIVVEMIDAEMVKFSTVLKAVKRSTEYELTWVKGAYSVLYSIEILVQNTRERDRIVEEVIGILRGMRIPSKDEPLFFRKAYNISFDVIEDIHRAVLQARFWAFDVYSELTPEVQETRVDVEEV